MSIGGRFCPQNWLPRQRPLRDRKYFRSFIHGQSSTNPAYFVKVGLVDIEIIGLTEVTDIFLKIKRTAAKHEPLASGAGGQIIKIFFQSGGHAQAPSIVTVRTYDDATRFYYCLRFVCCSSVYIGRRCGICSKRRFSARREFHVRSGKRLHRLHLQ